MDALTSPAAAGLPAELWQQLADNIPQLAWVAEADGSIIWYNRRWYDYTGTSFEEMQGWGWKSVHHPAEVDRVVTRFREAIAEQRPWEDVFPLRSKTGEYRSFLSRAQPMRDGLGRITHWFGTNTDITERAEAEHRTTYLLRLDEALRRADSAAAAKMAACSLLGQEIGASRVHYAEPDRQRSEFRIDEEYLTDGARSLAGTHVLPQAIFEAYAKGEPIVARDFREHPLLGRVELDPAIDPPPLRAVLDVPYVRGGELVGLLSVHDMEARNWSEQDVALAVATAERMWESVERARAEEQLRLSEAQFRTTADTLPGLLFVTNGRGENRYVNRYFKDYTGLGVLPTLDWWRGIVHPDDLPQVLAETTAARAEGRTFHLDYRIRRSDGEYRWHSTTAAPTIDDNGDFILWVGVSLDIHDRREAEERARTTAEEIEAIYKTAPIGLTVLDRHLRYVRINERLAEMNGVSATDHLGKTVREVVPNLGEQVEEQLRSVLEGETVWGLELSGETPAQPGVLRTWRENWLPVRGEGDEILGIAISAEEITNDKQAEAALRASELRYRTLFESMEQGFCILHVTVDEEGVATDYRFAEINPAFTRHSGLSPDVLHKSIGEAVPGLEKSWFERYGDVAINGVPKRFVDHAEPLGRWFDVYAFPLGDPADHNVAVLFSDITDRIAQEEALRNSEQELRLRLNAIPQMVWSTLPDGYHDFYNERWYEFTGVPPGSTDGAEWNGMFHPDDQDLAWERWRQSLETGEPYEIEYRLRHHSGTYRWVLGRALPIRCESGEIVRWMGTCTDIDDRIEAERRLQASEAQLRAIINAVPVGLMFANAEGRITGSNDVILDFLGHEMVPSEAVDDYEADYVAFHEDGRQVASHEYPMSRALAGEERPELECQVQRGDGSRKWLRYVAAPIRTEDGKITGGVVASIDIDRVRRLTTSLEREVEKVVAEREAAQEALRQSQKLEAMGQLTGGVAHDFNNLLTPIIGSLDLLQRKQILDERTTRLVDGALTSAEKARVLVQRLLAFARRQPLQPQAVDLVRIVREMSELIDSTSGPRVKVAVDAPDALPPALADGNQLEMALLNLAVNARDAMPDGGKLTIAVRDEPARSGTRLGLKAEPHLVLSVSDTGVGMDERTRQRAIEPFFSTKGVGKGTGLGLSMVHGLAAQLGGALDIRSAPGMGTTIELWLPHANRTVAAETPDGPENERHGAGLALLVDDEELVRTSTASMLSDLGYRVVEAGSGEEALTLVSQGLAPDLLITDQLMPGLSGTDLAVRLRQERPGVPVLIVSGYADLDSLSPSFPHLSKPFRQAELASALEKLAPSD